MVRSVAPVWRRESCRIVHGSLVNSYQNQALASSKRKRPHGRKKRHQKYILDLAGERETHDHQEHT